MSIICISTTWIQYSKIKKDLIKEQAHKTKLVFLVH